MSKFTVRVKLQGLEIEVDGTKEDAPRIAQKLGQQFGGLLQAPAILAGTNGNAGTALVIEGDASSHENGSSGARRKPRKTGGGGTKVAADDINLAVDPAKFGSPTQAWTTAQKAIWFLSVAAQTAKMQQLTASSIANNFNKHFRAAGQITSGNVAKYLDKERLKGTEATVGADTSSGATKYFLTQTGEALAQRLIRGEAADLAD